MANPRNPILYNESAELSLVGSVLADEKAWAQADSLYPESFSHPACRAVWELACERKGKLTTEEVVVRLAQQRSEEGSLLAELGGRAAVEALLDQARPLDQVEALAQVVQDCATNRQLKRTLEQGLRSLQPSDEPQAAAERIDGLLRDLGKISVGVRLDTSELARGAEEWERDFRWRLANPGKLSGLRVHFRDVDEHVIGGLEGGNFWVVASSPGEGKSIFVGEIALRLVTRAQDDGRSIKVGEFGVEMSGAEMYGRFLQSLAQVENRKLRDPRLLDEEDKRKLNGARTIFEARVKPNLIYMSSAQFGMLDDIIRQAKYLVKEHGVGCLVVDYLQRIRTKSRENRTDEIGDITSRLKNLALELNVPIIAVSQITREAGKNQQGKATMFDMAESSNVERDADYITTLWRPARHLEGKAQQLFKNVALLELVKGRFREASSCFLRFDGNCARFDDLALSEIDRLRAADAQSALRGTPNGRK